MTEMWDNKSEAVQCVNTERLLTRSLDSAEEGLAMQATRRCSVAKCDQPFRAKGFCANHYGRWKRYGDPLAGRPTPVGGLCSIKDCQRPHLSRTWCSLHYGRWQRSGDPMKVRPNPAMLPGEQNCKWKGSDVGYRAAHDRVHKTLGLATDHACVDCGNPAEDWSYDHLDPDERVEPNDPKRRPYSVNLEHYQARCGSCHWRVDHPTGKVTRA